MTLIRLIGEEIVGAIAVSKKEELQIERLRRELKIPTKQWRPSKPGRESG